MSYVYDHSVTVQVWSRNKIINFRWSDPLSAVKHTFEFMNGIRPIDMFTFSIIKMTNVFRVNTDHKPCYEEYVELHV